MWNPNKNGGARRPGKHWARQAGTALAAIPLLLQPLGASVWAESGSNSSSGSGADMVQNIVLSTKAAKASYPLSQWLPNAAQFNVTTDNQNVAEGLIPASSSVLNITPKGPGAATFTVTAMSAGQPKEKTLRIIVIDAGSDGRIDISDISKWAHSFPDAVRNETDSRDMLKSIETRTVNGKPVAKPSNLSRTVHVGESDSLSFNVSDYFSDPEGDELAISVEASDAAVATSFYKNNEIVIEGRQAGTTTLYIEAADAAGGKARLDVLVTVLPVDVPPANSKPELAKAITMYAIDDDEQDPLRISMDSLFKDPDGDLLTYTYTRTVGWGEEDEPESRLFSQSVSNSVYQTLPMSEGFQPLSEGEGEGEESDWDWGATVTRKDNTLIVKGGGGERGFFPTTIQVTAVDTVHFPNNPVTQTILIVPSSFPNRDMLEDRTIFKDARMEIDLHQKFLDRSTVTDATYHYYLGTVGNTVSEGTYSNAHIEGNKLIIEGTAFSGDGEVLFNKDHYKVIGLYDYKDLEIGAEYTAEVINSFDLGVDELAVSGSYLNLWNHLEHQEFRREEIGNFTVSGQCFDIPESPISGSQLQIGWTFGTEGEITVQAYQAYPYYYPEESEEEASTPTVTYKIRFFPHPLPPLL